MFIFERIWKICHATLAFSLTPLLCSPLRFSAHLHVKYPALFPHDEHKFTKFLALDKCLPRRDFLQVVDFPDAPGTAKFSYDPEWLAITKAYYSSLSLTRGPVTLPGNIAGPQPGVDEKLIE